jgi:hypothetical protein
MDMRRFCASPTCDCASESFMCSLWCGSLDIPAGARCQCRHDECLRAMPRQPRPFGAARAGLDLDRSESARRAIA